MAPRSDSDDTQDVSVSVPKSTPVPADPVPAPGTVVVDPLKDYDPHRGLGGEYFIDDQGVRRPVPAS